MQKYFLFSDASGSWSEVATIVDDVTDSIVFTDAAGASYLVFAHYDSDNSGYSYYDGSSWTTNETTDSKYLAVWDERLWGIDNAGQLWYAYTIGTETNDCKLPTPDGTVTGLFVARNAAGVPILYASTLSGLFAHDAENSRFVETQMTFPVHPNNGLGTTKWRDSVYIPSGLGIYKYINGSNSAVIAPVGPDRDDGLPSVYRGTITCLAGTHNELLAGIDATTAPVAVGPTALAQNQSSGKNQGADIAEDTLGYSTILGYNDMSWEAKWVADEQGIPIDTLHVSDLESGVTGSVNYRVWWGYNEKVYHMALQRDIVNPTQVPEFEYATSGFLETPWFDAFQTEVDKLALQFKIEIENASSNEKVLVEFGKNYDDENWTILPASDSNNYITTSGTTTFSFPNSTTPTGTEFRSIRFRITLNREAGATGSDEAEKSPDVVSMVMVYRKN